jgi:hypothetical protein
VQFDIGLGALRYQERRAVPDHGRAAEDRMRLEPDTFIGVMPDYRTVVELTNAISADGYYVKTVVEDHPNHDTAAQILKQGWEITGRWYEGVFPINFTVSLRGTAPQDGVTDMARARTDVEVTVDGTFPNAEMKRRIEDKWDGLHARVTALLAARAISLGELPPSVLHGPVVNRRLEISEPGSPGPLLPPLSVVPSANGPGPLGNGNYYTPPVVSSEIVHQGAPELPPDPSGTEDKVADLLGQRKSLRDQLIAKQLPADLYADLLADINAELRSLGWSQ